MEKNNINGIGFLLIYHLSRGEGLRRMLCRNVTHAMNKALGRFGQSHRRHFPAKRRISVELVPETRRQAEISRYVN